MSYLFACSHYTKLFLKYGLNAHNPWKKLFVDPTDITFARSRGYSSSDEYYKKGGYWCASDNDVFHKWYDAGEIKDGEWDKDLIEVWNVPKFIGVYNHFVNDVPWENTRLYKFHTRLVKSDIVVDGCRSKNELLCRYNDIDNLFANIRDCGYKTRADICEYDDFKCHMNVPRVSIGREGTIIFCGGGWHRFTISRILGVKSIEVRVLVRHRRWIDQRESFSLWLPW